MKTLYYHLISLLVIYLISGCNLISKDNLPSIIKKVQKSTVLIVTYDKKGEVKGIGTGFFISKDGDIITNRHILIDAESAQIKTSKGKVYQINSVKAEDKEADLIRVSVNIPPQEVYPLLLSSVIPQIGERIIVIGNPMGLESSVSDGIISAVREIRGFGKIIQITAPISKGSSGSPVVNLRGEVIGIATFQLVEGQNLNFAMPSERISKLTPQMLMNFSDWKSKTTIEWAQSVEGLFSLGLIHMYMKDYENALFYFKKILEKKPDFAEVYLLIGSIYIELGNYEKSIEFNYEALRINPDFAEAYINLGIAFENMGKHIDAIEVFIKSIKLKPDYPYTYFHMGVNYHALKIYDKAIWAFNEAIRIKPDYFEAYFYLGSIYEETLNFKKAIEVLDIATKLKPDYFWSYYKLAIAYFNLGKYEDAIREFKQAIKINPNFAEAHFYLGLSYDILGYYQEAMTEYRQSIKINPNFDKPHYNIGLLCFNIGDENCAFEEYRILKKLNTDLANELYKIISKKKVK